MTITPVGLSIKKFVELIKGIHSDITGITVTYDRHYQVKFGYSIMAKIITINTSDGDFENYTLSQFQRLYPKFKYVYTPFQPVTGKKLFINPELITSGQNPYYKHYFMKI